jgi:hypothetical protein
VIGLVGIGTLVSPLRSASVGERECAAARA